jgi:hypothetical protein
VIRTLVLFANAHLLTSKPTTMAGLLGNLTNSLDKALGDEAN